MEDTFRSQFRFPWPLYKALKDAATKNRRSLNAELVARLEMSFNQYKTSAHKEIDSLRDALSRMSLSEVMTDAEITMFAERMAKIISTK